MEEASECKAELQCLLDDIKKSFLFKRLLKTDNEILDRLTVGGHKTLDIAQGG